MTCKEKLVVVGNGMAPGRMLEHLLEASADRFDITIFNAEPRVNYDRLMLSHVLSGEREFDEIITHDDSWYESRGITLHKRATVTVLDRDAQLVTTDDGRSAHYDKLVMATGSLPRMLPVPGGELDGVVGYRDQDDVEWMLERAGKGGEAVVIGGGLLGLEAAAGLHAQGMAVTVVHLMPTLMERQLDEAAAFLLERAVTKRGIRVMTGAGTRRFVGTPEGQVNGVELDDGTVLAADVVVVAIGIVPSISLAQSAGLEVNRGVVVDDHMYTSDPDILALGECAEHRGMCYGLVAPLYDMAKVAAAQLLGDDGQYTGSVCATRLKVSGIDLYSAGDFADAPGREEIVLRDATAGVYKRLVIEDNQIVGTVLYGDTADGGWYFDMARKGTDISELRDSLIFGQAFQGGAPLDPTVAVAALPEDAEICGCNGVSKGSIVKAITAGGLTSLDAVRAQTKASSSCGSCSGLVEKLLLLSLGDAYQPAAQTPMCGCVDLSHDEVRRFIRAQSLKSIPEVMQALHWRSSCGCAKCRPALNYYLVCEWPRAFADDYQSRFINERAHANIQRNGTYSVVPRMWGGITSAAELRAIADVVDEFQVPTVKVTGGQRIDLLGIEKEQLPQVWARLGEAGFVSGHAYAKGVRTVKTCVGTDWCRFGTQDSIGLGITLEKLIWGSWTPHKVKLAVSGCPRNCAEATCKDIGVVCVDSGYEIHFGGAAGMEVKSTHKLCTVPDEETALEYIAALLQMYREQGHYLERIYKWSVRVGVDEITRSIVDNPEKRQAYWTRFQASQAVAQVDPWAERVEGAHAHEFETLQPMSLEAAE